MVLTTGSPGKFLIYLLLFSSCGSVTKSRLTLCDPMDSSTSGFPVLHYLPEFAQTHVHWVDNAIVVRCNLILCNPLLLPLIFSSIRALSNELALHIRWPKYWISASAVPINIQGWFPLGLTGLISLQSKGLSRIFSSNTVWKHQFFHAQPSLWSSSYICTWLVEKP